MNEMLDIIRANPSHVIQGAISGCLLTLLIIQHRRHGASVNGWIDHAADLRRDFRKSENALGHSESRRRAADSELRGYRDAVSHLTAHPTTVIVDPAPVAGQYTSEAVRRAMEPASIESGSCTASEVRFQEELAKHASMPLIGFNETRPI